jgi:hypothetical protein
LWFADYMLWVRASSSQNACVFMYVHCFNRPHEAIDRLRCEFRFVLILPWLHNTHYYKPNQVIKNDKYKLIIITYHFPLINFSLSSVFNLFMNHGTSLLLTNTILDEGQYLHIPINLFMSFMLDLTRNRRNLLTSLWSEVVKTKHSYYCTYTNKFVENPVL